MSNYENIKCLKSIIDESVILCDEIINVINSISTNMKNSISTTVMSTMLIKFYNKKARYKMTLLYFAHVLVSDHITIYNRYYLLSLYKT